MCCMPHKEKKAEHYALAFQCNTHNDDEANELGVRPLPALPCDYVPFLWRANDDLGGCNLLLVQLVVSSQFAHCDIVAGQALQEGGEEGGDKWGGKEVGVGMEGEKWGEGR